MSQPLSGIRVLDLTTALSGPYAAMILADLGADVIKIEAPDGDDTRRIAPHSVAGESAYFMSTNRNKRSVAINLKSDAGRAVFLDLVKQADVVLDNFRPGVMERLHLEHGTLAALNPAIITCSLTGFGATGPASKRPAFDMIIQAIVGSMSVTGFPDRPPARAGIPIGDLVGGLYSAIAVCAAVAQRAMTGRGSRASLSLLEANVSLLTYLGTNYFVAGKVAQPQGASHSSTAPYNAYRCGDGKWMVVAGQQAKFFQNLADLIGRPDLVLAEKYATHESRATHRHELDTILGEVFATQPRSHWLSRLVAADVPCAPVNAIDEVFRDPQIESLGMVRQVQGNSGQVLDYVRSPITYDGETAPTIYPPRLGEHTRDVLRDLLGYDTAKIDGLHEAGAVGAIGQPSTENAPAAH